MNSGLSSTVGSPRESRSPVHGRPMMAQQCVKDTDPVGAFDQAWDLWLAVDYKPIFATAQSALNGCPHDSRLHRGNQ